MRPDARGILKLFSDCDDVFAQMSWPTPPSMNVINTDAGISIPMPMAAGDGVYSPHFSASRVRTTPTVIPITKPIRHHGGRAPSPFVNNSAKPAHFTLIGEDKPDGPIPNLSRSTG